MSDTHSKCYGSGGVSEVLENVDDQGGLPGGGWSVWMIKEVFLEEDGL